MQHIAHDYNIICQNEQVFFAVVVVFDNISNTYVHGHGIATATAEHFTKI